MRCVKCNGIKEVQQEFNKLCSICKRNWDIEVRDIIMDQSVYKIENIKKYEKATEYLKTIMN